MTKIKSIEDFKKYNIICFDKNQAKKVLEILKKEEYCTSDNDVDKEDVIVFWDDGSDKFMAGNCVEGGKHISFYHFKKVYKRLNKEDPKTLVEFMRKEPIDVIIEDKNDYDNLIDYLIDKGVKWQDGTSLKSKIYNKSIKELPYYVWDDTLKGEIEWGDKVSKVEGSITVKELFKKFNIEYKKKVNLDFEVDENHRIIKINNYNSEKIVYYFKSDMMDFVGDSIIKWFN